VGQALHGWPPLPHSDSDCAPGTRHTPELQQPLPHEVAPHPHCPVAGSQSWPDAQAAQTTPPAPHEVLDWEAYGWHCPADVQHPLGHEIASHTH
jgi:hypothetical protein